MPFEFHPQRLEGLILVQPRAFGDPRGFFLERYKRSEFEAAGIAQDFVQDNHSVSARGILRGIHYQLPPKAQGKLVWVTQGTVWDVCVDLRKGSATFGQWHGAELSGENHAMFYVPPGFGHGFVVLSETAHFLYKCTEEYDASAERGVRWDDPELGIDWPQRDVLVSEKDEALPLLSDAEVFEGSCAMIWLVGCGGMLGSEVLALLRTSGVEHTATDMELDITSEREVVRFAEAERPRWIVNCAAYTAVDLAESEEASAHTVNADGARNLALAAKAVDSCLVHVSTDYVFDGRASGPYAEDAPTNPIGAYGRSKEAGERHIRAVGCRHAIVRTAWLHGPHGPNFVATMLRLMAERPSLGVVDDQHGSPTYAVDLASALLAITQIAKLSSGTYHFTNDGSCTWHAFAREIQSQALALGLLETAIPIEAIPTEAYPTPAARPANSRLLTDSWRALLGLAIPTWQDGLRRHLDRIQEQRP